jgi:tagatose 1,6-diphosphate aldolase GatY/KbaY
MSVVSAKQMLLKATEERYAVGAFNVTSMVQMQAVIEAAVNKRAPLIIQTSTAPAKFFGARAVAAMYRALAERAPIPVCLHLDHCTDAEFCKQCADAGYTNIMIDASKLPFEENLRQTKSVVDYCHSLGDITVEGELGTVAGVEDQIRVVEDEAKLCCPEDGVAYVERTGVDLFAPAIGTAHGVYATATPKLDYDRLSKVRELLNGNGGRLVPLVIHGGTGLSADITRRLVACGGAKFNVSTELKHALIDSTFDYISAHRQEYDPGKVDKAVKQATIRVIESWIDILGCAGKA